MWLCSSGLKTAGGVLLLVSITCFLALLSVNSDMIIFHYLFAGFNCVQVSPPFTSDTVWMVKHCLFSPSDPLHSSAVQPQGPFVFFFRIVFNKEARNAMKYCCSRKRPDHMIKSKASVSPTPHTLGKYSILSDTLWMQLSFSYMLGAFLQTLKLSHLSVHIFVSLLQHLCFFQMWNHQMRCSFHLKGRPKKDQSQQWTSPINKLCQSQTLKYLVPLHRRAPLSKRHQWDTLFHWLTCWKHSIMH